MIQIREDIKLFLLLITAVATSVAAYATYRIYLDQTESSTLVLEGFKIEGTKEIDVEDTSSLSLKKVKSEAGFDTYELPLQIGNHGSKDVDGIHLTIDVEGGELIVPNEWITGTYADNARYHYFVNHMTPWSASKLSDLKIKIKNNTHEAKLKWSILAKRTVPPDGTLILRF